MGARVVIGWLATRLASVWTGDPDDLVDWLAGNDDAITERVTTRRREALLAAGGEIG